MNFLRPSRYTLPEAEITPEAKFWDRREFLRGLALAATGAALSACNSKESAATEPTVTNLPPRPSDTLYPWTLEIGGLVQKPFQIGFEELVRKFPLEERIYRMRCVEAWSMVVPWVGFPFSKFIEFCAPLPSAKYVRFMSFYRPQEAVGQREQSYPWPYYEGLRLNEAMNELTLLTTGIYGQPLPRQHGAPLRLIVPWKYGYK